MYACKACYVWREGAEEGLCRGRRRQCLSYHVGGATREEEGKNAKPLTLFWFVFAHKV